MQINIIHLGLIKTNCYMVSTDKAAFVVDPGFESPVTERFLNDNSDKERLILITHAHFDHIGGAEALREKTGVKIGIGCNENAMLSDTKTNLSDQFHAHISPFSADLTYNDGETFTLGDVSFKVFETPGHTPGGVSYLCDNVLFSGDTLFCESVGRTDFPGGNITDIRNSVKRLIKLDENVTVYPGHGEATTIGHEKMYNSFI